MKKAMLFVIAMCISSLSIYADEGKILGEKTSGDFKVVIRIAEDKVIEKKPTNFDIEVRDKENKVTDATISLNCYRKMDGYVCPMDKDVQMEKTGKCPKCGMNLEKGKIRKQVGKESMLHDGHYKQTFDIEGDYEIEANVQPKKGDAFVVTVPFNVEKSTSCTCAKDMPDCDCEHCVAPKNKQASIACPCKKEGGHMDKKEHDQGHNEGHGHHH